MPKLSLENLAAYGGAAQLEVDDDEVMVGSPVQCAATCVTRYRAKAQEFERTRAEIEANGRFSEAGRKAELGDYATRTLNELGRIDASLELAQGSLDELAAEARSVSIDLTPAQLQLVPTVYARLLERDPLELPGLLMEAAEARDALTVATFISAPTSKSLRLAVTDAQVEEATETMAGALPDEDRKTLKRMRELVTAARSIRTSLVAEVKRAAGLEQDPIAAMLGADPGRPQDDPIARLAMGEAA